MIFKDSEGGQVVEFSYEDATEHPMSLEDQLNHVLEAARSKEEGVPAPSDEQRIVRLKKSSTILRLGKDRKYNIRKDLELFEIK